VLSSQGSGLSLLFGSEGSLIERAIPILGFGAINLLINLLNNVRNDKYLIYVKDE
jgi:hypothetical protein